MKRPLEYKTKQYEAILSYIASLGSGHVTAAHIVEHFNNEGVSISRPTVYRHLEKLAQNGKVRKYNIDNVSGACFQFIENNCNDCSEHYHLKCESCGDLLHFQCDKLNEINQHILDKHIFKINPLKTVLYGKCNQCI